MSIPHAKSGEVIQLPLGAALGDSKTTSLVKTKELELIRMVLPAGKEIPSHKAPGEITVQCLEGRIAFTAHAMTQDLVSGKTALPQSRRASFTNGNRRFFVAGDDIASKD